MITNYFECPNCKKQMVDAYFVYKGQSLYSGIYICPLCREIELPDEWIDKKKVLKSLNLL